jgi:hypothetical protein
MDEHPQDSDASLAGAHIPDKPEAPAAKVPRFVQRVLLQLTPNQKRISDALKALSKAYCAKCAEIPALASINLATLLEVATAEAAAAMHRTNTDVDLSTIDLDKLSTLDDYDRMLDLSNECVKLEVEYNARERVIITKLGEIVALEAKIMADHGLEMEEIDPQIKEVFAEARASTLQLRLSCMKIYRLRLSMGSRDDSESR